jgi:hypothetical protein
MNNGINKSELKLAIESCTQMKLVLECVEQDGNVRAQAIKTALKYTLQACGLIECKSCKEYASIATQGSEMCARCEDDDRQYAATSWQYEGFDNENEDGPTDYHSVTHGY